MAPQLFLIAPADAGPAAVSAALAPALSDAVPSALLLLRGTQAENAYKELVKAVLPLAQPAGCAVLIEGDPGLARTLGADGLHVHGDVEMLRHAVAVLHPGLIVGAGGVRSRDDAMTMGELGADYILFGPLSGAISDGERELARWWAETMEIPSVLSDPEAVAGGNAEGCEFIGLALGLLEPQA